MLPLFAGLTHLDLSANEFRRLPRSLAAATRMQRLSLVANTQLVLTAEDVDQVLDHMQG